jgi:protease II
VITQVVPQHIGEPQVLLLVTLLLLLQAPDGTEVPISLAYRKDLAKLDGSDPLLLHG